VLADFREWLGEIREQGTGDRGQSPAAGVLAPDLFSLVDQFTALRHEVNMQTRAARAAVEQNAEVLRHLEEARAEPEASAEDDDLRSTAKAMIDVADALALSLNQIERLRESIEPLLADLAEPPPTPTPAPGLFARLFGARPAPAAGDERSRQAASKLRQLAAAAGDGYAMSLRRVERILPTLQLEAIACTGEEFDPDLMEVVEVVADPDQSSGAVVEEVRPGYLWRGKVLRFAQVKVAR
jgi:molecular chaperone GrpE